MLHDLRTNGYILQKINRLNACYDFPVFNWNICMSIPRFFFTLSFCKRGSTLLCPSLPLAFCELTNFYAHKRSRGGNSECRVRFVCLNRYSPLRPIYACCRLLIKRRKSSVQLSQGEIGFSYDISLTLNIETNVNHSLLFHNLLKKEPSKQKGFILMKKLFHNTILLFIPKSHIYFQKRYKKRMRA